MVCEKMFQYRNLYFRFRRSAKYPACSAKVNLICLCVLPEVPHCVSKVCLCKRIITPIIANINNNMNLALSNNSNIGNV